MIPFFPLPQSGETLFWLGSVFFLSWLTWYWFDVLIASLSHPSRKESHEDEDAHDR